MENMQLLALCICGVFSVTSFTPHVVCIIFHSLDFDSKLTVTKTCKISNLKQNPDWLGNMKCCNILKIEENYICSEHSLADTWIYFLCAYVIQEYSLRWTYLLNHRTSAQVWGNFTAKLNFIQETQFGYYFLTHWRYLLTKQDSALFNMKTIVTIWSIFLCSAVHKTYRLESSSKTTAFPLS